MTLRDRDGHELTFPMDAAGQIWCDICQVHATPKPTTDDEWEELTSLEKFSVDLRDQVKKIKDAMLVPVLIMGKHAEFEDFEPPKDIKGFVSLAIPTGSAECVNNCPDNEQLKEYLCPDCGHMVLEGFTCCDIHLMECCE